MPGKDDDASPNLKERGFYLATERIGAVASRLDPRAAAACSHVRTQMRRSFLLFVPCRAACASLTRSPRSPSGYGGALVLSFIAFLPIVGVLVALLVGS